MLENKFVRTLLCFLLMFHTLFYTWSCSWFYTRYTFMVLLTVVVLRMVSSLGSTHCIRSWFYHSFFLWFLFIVQFMFSVRGSTMVLLMFMVQLAVSLVVSTLSFFLWFCSWFNLCSLFMVLLIVSSYGSTHGIRSWFTRSFFLWCLMFMESLLMFTHGSY